MAFVTVPSAVTRLLLLAWFALAAAACPCRAGMASAAVAHGCCQASHPSGTHRSAPDCDHCGTAVRALVGDVATPSVIPDLVTPVVASILVLPSFPSTAFTAPVGIDASPPIGHRLITCTRLL
jgi:hypothetical protein